MTIPVRNVLLTTILVLATGGFLDAQSAPTLDWTENSGSIVTGYAVTIDGVRVDERLTPLGPGGACGCSIVLPFSGGRHVIIVSAYNSSGETASAPLTVGPIANAGGPYSVQSGTPLAVNASGSTAPTGSLVSYSWHWGDGSSDTTASSPQASHTYAASGTFTITLTVTDNAGATSQATTTATVQATSIPPPVVPPPVVSLTTPAGGSTFVAPATIALAATATGGSVTKVAFYAGSSLLGTITSAPYSMTWTNVGAGTYSLTAVATNNGGVSTTSSPVTVVVNGGGSTPFWGTAAVIPGRIQAEDFDNGGQGVAYNDTTAGNSGGAYRATDVDIEASPAGGYDVGWVVAGEWLNYSVNVASAGSYTVTFRVAVPGQGGTFHLEMNGANVTGPMTVPSTGDWQTYATVSQTVTLAAGPQVARLVMDTAPASYVGNFDSMQFAASQ
jgi:PKD repeat protein